MAITISSELENLLYFERLITISFNKFLMVLFVKVISKPELNLGVFFCCRQWKTSLGISEC